jgi:hypothetical protein
MCSCTVGEEMGSLTFLTQNWELLSTEYTRILLGFLLLKRIQNKDF